MFGFSTHARMPSSKNDPGSLISGPHVMKKKKKNEGQSHMLGRGFSILLHIYLSDYLKFLFPRSVQGMELGSTGKSFEFKPFYK